METQELIAIDLIDPNPYQPRQAEDLAVVAEIAESIKRNGILQIPSARRVNGRVQLAFGHTRLAAYKHNGEECMPLIIRELDDLQMFELGVSENIKRRDLNPIEEARAMRRYMVEFKKNSVETGEFFNVSPEKVRSTVRLLNLPRNLQEGVSDGSITQNNARRLLTIQRVAPDQVKQVAKELAGKPNAEPDNVISNALRNNGTSVEMYSPSWRHDTEPLAGPSLWPLRLPAEKFPMQHLPVMTVGQAAKIVGGDWSGHQDKYVLQKKIEHFQSGGRVDDMPGYATYASGPDAEATLTRYERLAHLINPPACSACPFYAKVNGSHFCTLKDCYTRKSAAWRAHVLEKAVRTWGIAPYDHKTDGKFVELISYQPEHEKLVKNASPDLRLKKGASYGSFEGVPDGYIIVAVGKTAEKMLEKEKESRRPSLETNDESYHAEQRRLARMREIHREAAYDFLWKVGTPAFSGLLENLINLPFLKEFADRMVRGVPEEEPNAKAKKSDRLNFYRRALLFSLLDDVIDMWDICQKKKPVTALAKELQGIATTWGVKLPRNWLDQAANADKAMPAVTTETEKE